MVADAPGALARFLLDDHRRLEALLDRAATDPAAYEAFREGLLRHIAMEEKVRFAIREGGRTIGAGVVTKVVE